MRILFALDAPAWPYSVNGAVITIHEYALELIQLGHQVAVLGRFSAAGWRSRLLRLTAKLNGKGMARDRTAGYPIFQSWSVCDAAPAACTAFRPDVAVVFAGEMAPLARAVARCGPRIWLYHHTKSRFLDASYAAPPAWGQLACSDFIAREHAARHGVRPSVVRPFVHREKYAVANKGDSVLFVNPIPDKGVELALKLAERRPDVPFVFLESWSISNDSLVRTRERTRRLPNVTWQPSTNDMRAAFASTRLVLIPSRWEEPYGRLPGEAYCSGIPVLASAIGGLVESVGSGGRLVPPDATIDEWLQQFAALWDDAAAYERYSHAALAMSNRADATPRRSAARLLAILQGAPPQDGPGQPA